jgi:hypothetical protein
VGLRRKRQTAGLDLASPQLRFVETGGGSERGLVGGRDRARLKTMGSAPTKNAIRLQMCNQMLVQLGCVK